jgi:hypothetical protein
MEPTSARTFAANRMMYFLRALDKDHITRRLKEWGERAKRMMKDGKTLKDAEAYAVERFLMKRANQAEVGALLVGV